MTMQLQIRLPFNFPLHGNERDAFEAKLRAALRYVFDGRRVRQLAGQIDVRRPFEPSDVPPLGRIGDEHTFEQCMTLDRCRFDDMSVRLRRVLTNVVGARLGLELTEPRIVSRIIVRKADATNRLSPNTPPTPHPRRAGFLALTIAAGTAVRLMTIATTAWKFAHPAAPAPKVATIVSTSPAQTLRDLTSNMLDDGRVYRVTVLVEPQGADAGSH
jgi:hypothetical protein